MKKYVDNGRRGAARKDGVIANKPGSGQFIALNNGQLTEFATEFVENYVQNGGSAKAAYLMAGGDPGRVREEVARLMNTKKVQQAIRRRQLESVTSLANSAAGTIEELMLARDGTVPPAVRFQCARWCMETAGIGPQHVDKDQANQTDKPLEEMSIRELEAFISAGGQAVKAQREQEARTIDITPDQPGYAPDSAPDDPDDDDNSLI